jgi:membrane-bound ClpP family serine protease
VTPWLGLEEASFLLIAAGLICVVLWVASPSLRCSVISGSALLALGLVGLVSLPVHAAGVLLLAFAAASLCLEVLAYPGMGLHAIGGGVSLLLAGLFLTGHWSGAHPAAVLPVAVLVGVTTYWAGRRSWRYVRNKPMVPYPRLQGRRTTVLASTGPVGQGVIGGEVWQLRPHHGELRQGQAVEVVEVLTQYLVVEPTDKDDFS